VVTARTNAGLGSLPFWSLTIGSVDAGQEKGQRVFHEKSTPAKAESAGNLLAALHLGSYRVFNTQASGTYMTLFLTCKALFL
jgi:hypothetical protein